MKYSHPFSVSGKLLLSFAASFFGVFSQNDGWRAGGDARSNRLQETAADYGPKK